MPLPRGGVAGILEAAGRAAAPALAAARCLALLRGAIARTGLQGSGQCQRRRDSGAGGRHVLRKPDRVLQRHGSAPSGAWKTALSAQRNAGQ
jgi:hypothetical protein